MTTIFLAIIIGGAFGFALDRIGATNPGYIINMMRLTQLHLMKTILLGIGVASILLFTGLSFGLVEPGHLSVKPAYIGVFVGGGLLGIGFAIAGYCPGTGITAAATGRKDAIFFVIGGLLGAAAYMVSYEWIKTTGLLDSVLGGKTTLGSLNQTDYSALLGLASGEVLGIAMGFVFVVIAWMLPDQIVKDS